MKRIHGSYILVLLVLLSCLLGIVSTQLTSLVVQFGHFIPSKDIISDYLTALLCASLFFILIFASWLKPDDKKAFLFIWLMKCAMTLGAMLIYENSYNLDAFWYFNETKRATFSFDWEQIAMGASTNFMSGICWTLAHSFNLQNSYHSLKVIFSMIGLLAIYFFYLGFAELTRKQDIKTFYFLALFPSVLFWSSILGKDPINLFGIGLFFCGMAYWYRREKWIYFFLALIGGTIACMMRMWFMVILLLPFIIFLLKSIKVLPAKIKKVSWYMVPALVGLAIYGFQSLMNRFGTESLDAAVRSTNKVSHSWNFGNSAQEVPKFTSIAGIFQFAPYGMFSALFRPLPGDVMNAFGLVAGFENIFLLYLVATTAYHLGLRKIFKDNVATWIVSTILVWAFIYAFISPQNMGSAARFKLQMLPLILVWIRMARLQKDELCVE